MRKGNLSELKPDTRNANKGTQRGAGMLEKSLRQFGAGRSILVDKDGNVIAGNKTLEAAAAIGLENVRVIETDGTELVVVKRTDVKLDSKRGRELAIADNRTSQVGLEWDAGVIGEFLDEQIPVKEWFNDDELAQILGNFEVEGEDFKPQCDEDEVPATAPARCELGDMWQLGRHRLLCGDSTKRENVERVLNGASPALMVTDPPYGVEYDADWRNHALRADGSPSNGRAIGKVMNDDKSDWREAWALAPCDVVYCWHGDRHASSVQSSLESAGFELRAQLIWAKSNFAISRGHYHFQHEPCWYAVRKGKTANWIGDHKQTSLWEIPKPQKSETGHSTQKPVECMRRPMLNHEGDVYDPFLGSGTTLIAAEEAGRTCYGIELNPAYCDIILQRWETYTGQKAVKWQSAEDRENK